MRAEDKTIGLTFMWNLSEEKLREILASNQMPRIQNGIGVLMPFLCLRTVIMWGRRNLVH